MAFGVVGTKYLVRGGLLAPETIVYSEKPPDLGPTGNNMGPTKQESAVLVNKLPNLQASTTDSNTHKGAS